MSARANGWDWWSELRLGVLAAYLQPGDKIMGHLYGSAATATIPAMQAGRDGLVQGQRRHSSRRLELEAENEELKAALGEAHVQLRVWKKGAEYLPASRTLR